jgi:hypothetical protein
MNAQARGAEELVRRSRAGDQIAMDTLGEIAKNAKAGNPTARSAYGYILEYIKTHPAKIKIGMEDRQYLGILRAAGHNHPQIVVGALSRIPQSGNPDVISSAVVALANACPWNKTRISAYDSVFAGEAYAHQLWRFGYQFSGSPELQKAPNDAKSIGVICAGHCIGSARKIQMARLKGIPVSVLGAQIGWELGIR